jgi:hypothetical protein
MTSEKLIKIYNNLSNYTNPAKIGMRVKDEIAKGNCNVTLYSSYFLEVTFYYKEKKVKIITQWPNHVITDEDFKELARVKKIVDAVR